MADPEELTWVEDIVERAHAQRDAALKTRLRAARLFDIVIQHRDEVLAESARVRDRNRRLHERLRRNMRLRSQPNRS